MNVGIHPPGVARKPSRPDGWNARYFSPEMEVPFCIHATVALGAALALHQGDSTFRLRLSRDAITVRGWTGGDSMGA